MKMFIKGIYIRKKILKAIYYFLDGNGAVFEHPFSYDIRPETGNALDFEKELGGYFLFGKGVFICFNVCVSAMVAMGFKNRVEIVTGIDVFEITAVFKDEIKGFTGYFIIIRSVIAAQEINGNVVDVILVHKIVFIAEIVIESRP